MPQSDQVIGWIREIVLDTPDPHRLAGFWAALLGGTPVQWYPGWVTLEPPPHGQRLSFQGTGAAAPAGTWARAADGAGRGVHFDVLVSDLDGAQQRVVALGGTYVERHISPRPGPAGEQISWRVCRDPDGHLFCLVSR
jgi:predicted enzyme related to lactoylglutathione lyase